MNRIFPLMVFLLSGTLILGCVGTISTEGSEGYVQNYNGADGGKPGSDSNPVTGWENNSDLPQVLLSEIMYHPVLEESFDDEHEFVEIYNTHSEPVDLTGWRLGGGIRFVFPQNCTIAAKGFIVVAKNRDSLLALSAYNLDPNLVVGNFEGELDNGGDTVTLSTPNGEVLDEVSYDDEFPWPLAADALGAGQSWLSTARSRVGNHPSSGH